MKQYSSVFITTLGCKVNQFESAALITEFEKHHISQTDSMKDADIIIINTCCVTARAGAQSRNLIRKASRENNHAKIVVTGCYTQLESKTCSQIEEIQEREVLFVGNQYKDKLVETVLQTNKASVPDMVGEILQSRKITHLQVGHFSGRTRAYLKIQDGCNAFCTYCIVPYTRGPSRSLPIDKVIAQAKEYERQGHLEIVLTGIHVGNYGQDLDEGLDIVSCIERLCQATPNVRYRLSSIEPMEISTQLLHLMRDTENFLNHLHIPLQSGCDSVLKRMGRKYTTAHFKEIVDKAHLLVPGCAVGIDVLAGFPGETEEEFLSAKNFLQALEYTYLHVFPYSRRPGTKAADFPDQLSKQLKHDRVTELRSISDRKKEIFYDKFLGQTRNVLIENHRDSNGKLKGFTDNYIPVLIQGEDNLKNSVRPCRLLHRNATEIHGELVI